MSEQTVENDAPARSAVRRVLAKVPGFCPVTGYRRCPWHPDGGNHPGVGGAG